MSIRHGSTQVIRIAFATSESAPASLSDKRRWTELAVYYDPAPEIPGKPWIAVARGCSTHPGETLKEEIIQVGTLDRALKLFGDSQLGRSVCTQAEDWRESQVEVDGALCPAGARRSNGFVMIPRPDDEADDEFVMRWLYGDELADAKPQTLLARDFGAGESTVRAAIAGKRPIKVPFAKIARFIDRDAFRQWREAQGA